MQEEYCDCHKRCPKCGKKKKVNHYYISDLPSSCQTTTVDDCNE